MASNIYLASKPRYEILDGLRGVAAMIVVAYHLLETYTANPAEQLLNHGYFCLAIGIAYACLKLYDEPIREKLKLRFLMKRHGS